MSIENQIAIHADEPEQISAHEYFKTLDKLDYININGELYFYDDILDMIDDDTADKNEIIKQMIDKIQDLIS